jgi:monothiol glutaredoxin
MRRFLVLAAVVVAATAWQAPTAARPEQRCSSRAAVRMDAMDDVAAMLGMTDPADKKSVVDRLATEQGLAPAEERIKKLVSENKVMLFIKGTKLFPQCGFSNTAVNLVGSITSDFATFDVLSDESIREGIKQYSNWPTIPQCYVRRQDSTTRRRSPRAPRAALFACHMGSPTTTASSVPHLPQVNGEFIGGADILIEMHENGELKEEIEKALA